MYEPVLVLNANFEPINVCSTRRAIGLILAEKAAMVVNGTHPHYQPAIAATIRHPVRAHDPPATTTRETDSTRGLST